MTDTPVNLAFQEYLSKHIDEKVIDFGPLLASHPHLRDQLQKKIDAYRFIHGAIRSSKDVMVGKTLGGCVIKRLIREGGMSFVYLAHQTSLGRDVALKILKSTLANSEASISRFQRECRNISRLDHEHILPVYDVGFEDGLYYVITKHVDGVSVEDVIRLLQKPPSQGQLLDAVALLAKGDPAEWRKKFGGYGGFTLSVLTKTARALAFAHSRGIIHRDVKPSNILITKNGEPILIDFGLSRDIAQTSLTLSGEYIGTPVYSSPEQLSGRGEQVDERSDVYSLGITGCEFLTGRLPFSGENMLEILANSKSSAPDIPPTVGAETREILLKAISRTKEQRYGTMTEFAEDLAKIQDQDISPSDSKKVLKTTKSKRWHRKIMVLGVVGIIAAFGLFQLWHYRPKPAPPENTEVKTLKDKAERGAKTAQLRLCVMYAMGDGVSKDFAKALEWCQKAASQGDAGAQYNLGVMYANGEGIPKDPAKALEWYQKSASQEYPPAQFNLAVMYATGDGVPKDSAKAVEWYQKAAVQGDSRAQYNLGIMYAEGDGVPKDVTKAAEWWQKAASQGNANAQFELGLMYANGEGVKRDYAEAFKWWSKAADQGNAGAQTNLGLLYSHGDGVKQDYTEAVKWYRLASEQGNDRAQNNLGLMYLMGEGVPRDAAKAAEWRQKAATQGNAEAQRGLGVMYCAGEGVPQDPVLGYAWLNLAAANANDSDQIWSVLGSIGEKLTAEERAEAEALSSSWKVGEVLERVKLTSPKKGANTGSSE